MSANRDHILEQAMKHELRAAGTSPAGVCLDAETLGAWMDGGLDPVAMAATEAHISNCAQCQVLAATVAKSAPLAPDAPGTLGTLGTLGTPGTLGTLSLWRWWLAPFAAGATAVTLWMVIPEQQELATAPHAEIAKAAPAPVQAESVPPPAAPPDAAADRLARRDDQLAAGSREDRQRQTFADERKEKEEEPARLQERAAVADAAAVAPAAPSAPAAAAPAAVAESAIVAPRENAAPAIAALQKSARPTAAPIEIATLDPARGWRIAGDRIERSDDEGKTWTVMHQSPGEGLAAGSAPSNAVCWFVGRAGRVLLTVDAGATFNDVSLAEPLDLASIAATDARNASVYSVVGRRFRTADGGRTWRPF